MRTARHSESETALSSKPEFYGSVFVTFNTRQVITDAHLGARLVEPHRVPLRDYFLEKSEKKCQLKCL